MTKIINLVKPQRDLHGNPSLRRDDVPTPRSRLPNGAGPRSPRVQIRLPLISLAETEQHLDTLLNAVLRGQKYLRTAKRTGEHGDGLELVRRAMARASKLINAKRVPIEPEETL